ncbi:hypothetical protein D3C81_1902280 [compost metagenome]
MQLDKVGKDQPHQIERGRTAVMPGEMHFLGSRYVRIYFFREYAVTFFKPGNFICEIDALLFAKLLQFSDLLAHFYQRHFKRQLSRQPKIPLSHHANPAAWQGLPAFPCGAPPDPAVHAEG